MFNGGDIVFVQRTPFKFLFERKEKGSYVIENFKGELFEFPIDEVRKGSKMETLRYLQGRIAHWELMLKGSTELVEEHSQYVERLNERIKNYTKKDLPELKAKYDSTAVALRLIGKANVDKKELDIQHAEAKIELDKVMGQLAYCEESLKLNKRRVEEYKRDVVRSKENLEIFNGYKEKLNG
jgi:hypothetical protein